MQNLFPATSAQICTFCLFFFFFKFAQSVVFFLKLPYRFMFLTWFLFYIIRIWFAATNYWNTPVPGYCLVSEFRFFFLENFMCELIPCSASVGKKKTLFFFKWGHYLRKISWAENETPYRKKETICKSFMIFSVDSSSNI